VDPRYSPSAEAFRAEVAATIARHLPPDWPGIGALPHAEAEAFTTDWRRTLYEEGLLGVAWPTEFGGGGRTKLEHLVIVEECARARVPMGPPQDTVTMKLMGNTLVRWGTDEQKARFLPRILSGADTWAQGYSEPEAGSDLASLRTTAVRDGDEWVVNGQKIWTSGAHLANWMFLLARTNPQAPKHKGISFLLTPMDAPGIEVRPIRMTTDRTEFSEVFFTDVRIPVDMVLGPVDGGWTVAMSLLASERGEEAAVNPIMFRAELDRLVDLAREHDRADDPVIRDRLAWCYTQVETMRFLGYRILTAYLRDGALGPEASVSKLYWSEYHQAATRLAMQILGLAGLVPAGRSPLRVYRTDDPGAPNSTRSWVEVFLLNAMAGTVYAGTSQVQRNILGESILGLPKEPTVG
jgi:alkylation response protein AidB-like acyl-CoA dehydrogenase